MALTFEPDIAESWLYQTLTNDAVLAAAAIGGVHNTAPPQNARRPYIVFQHQAGRDNLTGRQSRTGTTLTYLVRGIADGATMTALSVIAARIDELLNAQAVVTNDGRISSVRRGTYSFVEQPQGIPRINHRGGFYELFVQRNDVLLTGLV